MATASRRSSTTRFVELGAEVLGFEGYDPKAPDYQALMTKIADAAPDLVYVGATVDNNPSKVLLDMRSLMPADEVIFLGPDGLITQAFIDGAGDAAEGAFITFAGLPPAELEGPGADFVTRMSEILGHAPDALCRPTPMKAPSPSSRRSIRSARRIAARSSTP